MQLLRIDAVLSSMHSTIHSILSPAIKSQSSLNRFSPILQEDCVFWRGVVHCIAWRFRKREKIYNLQKRRKIAEIIAYAVVFTFVKYLETRLIDLRPFSSSSSVLAFRKCLSDSSESPGFINLSPSSSNKIYKLDGHQACPKNGIGDTVRAKVCISVVRNK